MLIGTVSYRQMEILRKLPNSMDPENPRNPEISKIFLTFVSNFFENSSDLKTRSLNKHTEVIIFKYFQILGAVRDP